MRRSAVPMHRPVSHPLWLYPTSVCCSDSCNVVTHSRMELAPCHPSLRGTEQERGSAPQLQLSPFLCFPPQNPKYQNDHDIIKSYWYHYLPKNWPNFRLNAEVHLPLLTSNNIRKNWEVTTLKMFTSYSMRRLQAS